MLLFGSKSNSDSIQFKESGNFVKLINYETNSILAVKQLYKDKKLQSALIMKLIKQQSRRQ